ncbi:ATP-dependent endonuclease [Dyadobacter endophyticus]|uniref:ATP-dependent endonuclease n=1 Tax=Dyadobacter endophyticus TaxID=1749036 RepID=A0ABQ1YG46_9BACT|nr:AAA family ATPase [Dyadobacter endophyticus]GGH24947.1 ATP-dependent endonuclease [Dyadobacter endophyticus]
MYISKLSIRNFRNFRNTTIGFKKGINTLIGENGSGKSNVLYALRLLIDESLPRAVRFNESDFNRSLGSKWHGHWIIIQIEFLELDAAEEAQAIAMHQIGDMETYDSKVGSYALIFRPKEKIRQQLYECASDRRKSQESLAQILDAITLNDYEVTFRGRGNVDFSIDTNYQKYVGDFDEIQFPDPNDKQEDVYGIRLQGFSIPNELSCTFIKALRDVEADLRSFRDNPLLSLLRGKEKSIPIVEKESIVRKVVDLNDEIGKLDEINDVAAGITHSIKSAVGETYAPGIEIRSEVPSDIEQLLQSLKLWVGDPDEPGYKGRIRELSLGGANLIFLSLKLLEYERVKALDKIANFLLIEEPEAHIHTHIQKTLFHKVQNSDTQIIVTTHSTQISSVSKISSVNILSRSQNQAQVFNPSNGLSEQEVVAIERYLDAVRTDLLFAKGVVLVEGDAEHIIIPTMFKKIFGASLDEIGVSLVNIGSTGFSNIASIFHNDRVRKKCAIITDEDKSILDLPDDKNDDTLEERSCRNSEISGARRKRILDRFCKTNKWVSPFYGKHTFEVEFVGCGNDHEVRMLVEKHYSNPSLIREINDALKSEHVDIYGKEILRLANRFKKGWFALKLEEHITHLTFMPTYILEAITFACPHVSFEVLRSMALFRLQAFAKRAYEDNSIDYAMLTKNLQAISDAQESVDYFATELPDDQLSKFIELTNSQKCFRT